MKQSKAYLILFLMCFAIYANAQEKVTNIFGISPNLTHTYDADKYPFSEILDESYLVDNDYYTYSNKKMSTPKFTSYGIPITFSKEQAKNFFLNVTFSFGQDNYSKELSYSAMSTSDFKSTSQYIREDINAFNIYSQLYIGKAIYFTTEKKLMLMPYFGGFLGLYEYERTLSSDDKFLFYNNSEKSAGYNSTAGINLGLAINYQFTKHFGLGLNFNEIIKLSQVKSKSDYDLKEDVSNQMEINANKAPRISLLYYFKSKPGLFY